LGTERVLIFIRDPIRYALKTDWPLGRQDSNLRMSRFAPFRTRTLGVADASHRETGDRRSKHDRRNASVTCNVVRDE
jgi:hypothetical protein